MSRKTFIVDEQEMRGVEEVEVEVEDRRGEE